MNLFVDRAVSGSTLLNQTVTFGGLTVNGVTGTLVLTGRDGYGASFLLHRAPMAAAARRIIR